MRALTRSNTRRATAGTFQGSGRSGKAAPSAQSSHVSPAHPWVNSLRANGPFADYIQTTPSSHNRGLDNGGANLPEIWQTEGGRNLYRKYDGFGDLANLNWDNDDLQVGVSPRGALALAQAARATAVLHGRDHCVPEDIVSNVLPICAHRVISKTYMHAGDTATTRRIVQQVLETVPAPA